VFIFLNLKNNNIVSRVNNKSQDIGISIFYFQFILTYDHDDVVVFHQILKEKTNITFNKDKFIVLV